MRDGKTEIKFAMPKLFRKKSSAISNKTSLHVRKWQHMKKKTSLVEMILDNMMCDGHLKCLYINDYGDVTAIKFDSWRGFLTKV